VGAGTRTSSRDRSRRRGSASLAGIGCMSWVVTSFLRSEHSVEEQTRRRRPRQLAQLQLRLGSQRGRRSRRLDGDSRWEGSTDELRLDVSRRVGHEPVSAADHDRCSLDQVLAIESGRQARSTAAVAKSTLVSAHVADHDLK
jgi:hypothetical protein